MSRRYWKSFSIKLRGETKKENGTGPRLEKRNFQGDSEGKSWDNSHVTCLEKHLQRSRGNPEGFHQGQNETDGTVDISEHTERNFTFLTVFG